MPRYNLKCQACQHVSEATLSVGEMPSPCGLVYWKGNGSAPCGGQRVRIYTDVNFVLKGDGWYSKDSERGERGND